MPRMKRVMLPGYPHHIVHRGHNRQVVFAEPADYQHYLDTLSEYKEVYGIQVYAWCLMTNHVHLLLAPGLACVRYIELNPVCAQMVASPESYPWSSCHCRMGPNRCAWLDDDPSYLALGATDEARRRRYRAFLEAAVPDGERWLTDYTP